MTTPTAPATTPPQSRTLLANLDRLWMCEAGARQAFGDEVASMAALRAIGVPPPQQNDKPYDDEDHDDDWGISAGHLVAELRHGVATLHVRGMLLTSVPWWYREYGIAATDLGELRAMLLMLRDRADVEAVQVICTSPGGTATGTPEAAHAMRLLAEAKPTFAHAEGICASAMYYIASQARRLTATPSAMVGSIGTVAVITDTTAWQETIGWKDTAVASAPRKADLHDGKVSEEVVAEVQRRIDDISALFFDAVQMGRDLDDGQLAAITTGQVWVAAKCPAGLIDALTHEPEDPIMDTKLVRLVAAHPQQATFIAERMEAGDDLATIQAAVAQRVQGEQTAALQAERDALQAANAALQAERDALQATNADLQNQLTTAQNTAAGLQKLGSGTGEDPGGDQQHDNGDNGDTRPTFTRADMAKGKVDPAELAAGRVRIVD